MLGTGQADTGTPRLRTETTIITKATVRARTSGSYSNKTRADVSSTYPLLSFSNIMLCIPGEKIGCVLLCSCMSESKEIHLYPLVKELELRIVTLR